MFDRRCRKVNLFQDRATPWVELSTPFHSHKLDKVRRVLNGAVGKKGFSRTEGRFSVLLWLDEFSLNPLSQSHSGSALKTFRNALGTNPVTNKDDSQRGPRPEAIVSQSQITQNSGPDDGHDMVTGIREEVTYCSPGASSGKRRKTHSASQRHFRIENTPTSIEADQILLAFQQLAKSISSNVNYIIQQIFKLPKSLTTKMPGTVGKSEKIELFGDPFQTGLRIHIQLTEDDRINYFHSFMKRDLFQTFKNINSPTRVTLGEVLTVFCRKYVKPQSRATAKHKFQKVVRNATSQKLKVWSRN